jgi:uncharacterized protein DUF3179
VADGQDIGAVAAYLSDDSFERTDRGFVDQATGSTWNILGIAIAGPRTGDRLEPLVYLDTFWFAWSAYFPETELLD